jgi:glycosyltransferase involved in cell wall biosynthesis
MNIVVINNSTNPDMAIYFEAKKYIDSKALIFAANSFFWGKDQVHLSSISPKNKLTWHFFIDCLISIFLAIKMKFKGIDCLLFDTAHISNIPLAFAAKFLGLKLVFTIHDWNPHEGKMAGATHLYNKVVESFLADHFVVFSPIDTVVSYSVLKLSGFKSDFEKSNTSNQSFLFFGRIEPYKGLHNLVNIAEEVKRNMPDADINVMGAGSDKAIDALLALSNVNVVNEFISEEDLNSQLRKTTAVILPYDSATQSGVIIKSFSMGIPVIAHDVGALRYYVDNGSDGILVRHGDVKGFVEAMIEISENFTAFSNTAEKNFTKNYSEQALVNQYEELLLSLGEKFERNK